MGYISDHTRTKWGRRRPYMLAGAVPLGLATWLLYSIPAELSGVIAFLTIVGSFLLFDTMYTVIHVPYVSLTPELTHDYEERTSLTTVRMIFSSLGYILGAAATTARDQNPLLPVGPSGPAKELFGPRRVPEIRKEDQDT